MAEQDGRKGLIPINYIEMKPHEWFHGKFTRAQAEDVLSKQQHIGPGAFLILRESESTPGGFSLSVLVQVGEIKIEHYKILRDGKLFVWTVKFITINQLVEYYRTSSISQTKYISLKDMLTTVVAVFDFKTQEDDELPLQKGDVITVLERTDHNRWRGTCNGRSGLFPVTYVKST